MIQEYEIKSEITPAQVNTICKNYSTDNEFYQIDEYFDTKEGSLFETGVFVRVRDNNTLDIKYNPNFLDTSHTVCNEYSYSGSLTPRNKQEIYDLLRDISLLPEVKSEHDKIRDFLMEIGLTSFVTINKKRRKILLDSKIDCVIDEIKGIGTFVELEVNTEDLLPLLKKWIDNLNLKNIPIGYVELWLKKHDIETYLRGRYILEDDKK